VSYSLSINYNGAEMNTFILILYIYAGALSNSDSVALTSATFSGQQACESAGKQAVQMAGGLKGGKFVCVKQ
jgi:hypothetical protein